jgi:hypothetical protein
MPYIKQEQRNLIETKLQSLIDEIVALVRFESMSVLPGILNYTITSLIKRVYKQSLQAETQQENPTMTYSDHNEIVGMLDCAKMEFYRRNTAPYEDTKIVQNGDV